jgi:hypothetical protein
MQMNYVLTACLALTGLFSIPIDVQAEEKSIPQSTFPTTATKPATTENPASVTLPKSARINDSTISFSYSIEFQNSKAVSSENITLTLFLIEPDGNLRETQTPHISLNEGKNTGGFNDAFVISNPLKGNYVIGCLALVRSNDDMTTSFTGNIKGVLKTHSKTETLVSAQIPKQNLSGSDVTTLSSNIVLLDNISP